MADGTIIENGRCGFSEGFLWLWFTGYSIVQAAQMFLDPAKTDCIVFEYGEMSDTYTGFDECTTIMVQYGGEIAVCLKGGSKDV